jgi:5'-nucleotidase
MSTTRSLRAAAACAAAFSLALPGAAAAQRGGNELDVQLLAFNDFHGNLESGGTVTLPDGTRPVAGGVAYLDTHLDRLRSTNPRATFTISTGDLIGASPLVSAIFKDEPTIEAMNLLGLDMNVVGNHEFDEGIDELERMRYGGCHPTEGCFGGDGFEGADFPFLAANVVRERTGETIFPPYVIHRVGGERIAFVGTVLEETPSVVSQSGVAGLDFRDEADTMNALMPELKRRGVETVIAVVHQGGVQEGQNASYNDCKDLQGPIVDIVNRTSDEVDVFLTGHTHQGYNCEVDGRTVISGLSFGRLISDVDLTINRRTGETTEVRARNRVVTRDVTPDAELQALVARYQALAAPIAARPIGEASAAITRATTPAGESALGDVIADAQLAATSSPGTGGAQIAFMNPGGIRTDLDAGPVTYGEAFSVQPFGNSLVTMSLTGAQIDTLLEQQFSGGNAGAPRVLQPSAGFSYTWDPNAPAGAKVDPATIRLNGTPLDPQATYRVTVNSFLAEGGDAFAILTEGTDRLGGAVDVDAFEAFFRANSPVAPGPQNRISIAGAAPPA